MNTYKIRMETKERKRITIIDTNYINAVDKESLLEYLMENEFYNKMALVSIRKVKYRHE